MRAGRIVVVMGFTAMTARRRAEAMNMRGLHSGIIRCIIWRARRRIVELGRQAGDRALPSIVTL